MRCILFDIDGTLVRGSGAGRQAMAVALTEVFGTTGALETHPFGGRTDLGIVFDLMTAEGFSAADVRQRFPEFSERMAVAGAEFFTVERFAPCPGVPELLGALAHFPDVYLGLLTGNITETAPLKLRAAGIDPALFRFGAYGSDSAERNELVPIAVRRAEAQTGITFHGRQIVTVGDTPADIACARAGGAIAFAVATGFSDYEALRANSPDFLFPDMTNLGVVLAALVDGDAL